MIPPERDYIDTYYRRTTSDDGEPRPPLEGRIDTEVCVIGGGLAGLSTALCLAESGTAATLIESRRVGWGASGRNGGFVLAGFSLSESALIAKVGIDAARELYELSRLGAETVRRRIEDHAIRCGPVVMGGLRPSRFDDPESLKRHIDFMAKSFGEESQFWPRERLREALVTRRYYDALFKPDAFQFHPLNYCRGLAQVAETRGVRIYEGTPATRVELGDTGHRIETERGSVLARHVVFCCGGYIERLNPRLSGAIVAVATYVIATEPLCERIEEAIRVDYSISDDRFANDYYRRLPDTRILWGGRISVRRSRPPDLSDIMLRDLTSIYPQLRGVRIETAWHGLMSYASHKMPQVGRLSPNVWYAMGFGGHGMNTTTMAGELVAAAIARGDDRYRLLEPFGLTPTGGPIGAAAAQLTYWYFQLKDALRR